jgi:hypothetical protein
MNRASMERRLPELTITIPMLPKSANLNSPTLRCRFLLFAVTGENGGDREVCPTDQGI